MSCLRKPRGRLMRLEPTTSSLRVRRATHCDWLIDVDADDDDDDDDDVHVVYLMDNVECTWII